jgi:anti-sigma-K factor RskA
VNIQEYISSGIIESYVLGLADAGERAEFEQLLAQHPELRQAMEEFELSLERHAQHGAIQPPAHIKGKVFSAIELESGGNANVPPVIQIPQHSSGNGGSGRSTIGVRRDPTRWLAAAAVILLLVSTALNFYFFNRYKEFNTKYQALVLSQTELASHNQILQTRILEYEKAVEMMKDPAMYIVKMPSVPASPDPTSATTVYWDTRTKDVYIAINKLPAPAQNEQYQLWAMVDGKPVDAGVFDLKDGAGMTKMKNIPKAEAFAVTLERKGGSPTPSLDKLYVMGKV